MPDTESVPLPSAPVEAASGLERQQGLTHKLDVVDADDLHTLAGDGQRGADTGGRAIRLFVLQDLPQEGLPGISHQQRALQRVKSPALRQQREIVLVGLAEADARVKTDPLGATSPAASGRRPLEEIPADVLYHIVVNRIVLHRGGCASHMHYTHAYLTCQRRGDHLPVRLQAAHVVDDLRAGFNGLPRDGRFGRIDR